MRWPDALAPLRSRRFRIYWVGQAISLVGTWMQLMAQGWVVTRLTTSAFTVGALAVAGQLPIAALALVGGQVADRRSRRNVLLVTQAILATLALGLATLAFTGRLALWHLFAFSCMLGVTTAFDLPAAQAFAPELVAPPEIPRAVALMQAIFHGSRMVGPALAGVCIARFGEASAFLANGVSFLAVIASLSAIPGDRPASAGRPMGGGGATEGIGYLRRHALLRVLFGLLGLCMLLAFPFVVVLMPYYAKYVVLTDAAGMGSIMSASGLGALVGAGVLVAWAAQKWRQRVALGVVLISGALVGLGVTHALATAIAFTATLSLGTSLYLGTITQVVQQRVPNHLRGRVMALFGVGMTTLMPLSGLALSAAADRVGLARLMMIGGASFLVAATLLASRLPPEEQEPA